MTAGLHLAIPYTDLLMRHLKVAWGDFGQVEVIPGMSEAITQHAGDQASVLQTNFLTSLLYYVLRRYVGPAVYLRDLHMSYIETHYLVNGVARFTMHDAGTI